MFKDDLEKAVRAHTKNPEFFLVVTPRADSAVTAYTAAHLGIGSRGRPLPLTLVGSGEEKGLKPELDIWWLDLRFDAQSPLRGELEVRNDLLFELYRDQMNVMKFRLPGGEEKTVVFVPGEERYRLKL